MIVFFVVVVAPKDLVASVSISEPFSIIFVPAGGGAPGSSGFTGIVLPGAGTELGAAIKSDGGIGFDPGGATGTGVGAGGCGAVMT